MAELFTLDDILKWESCVFLDKCVIDPIGDWYRTWIVGRDSFEKLNRNALRDQAMNYAGQTFLLDYSALRSSIAINKELQTFSGILHGTRNWLRRQSEQNPKQGRFLQRRQEHEEAFTAMIRAYDQLVTEFEGRAHPDCHAYARVKSRVIQALAGKQIPKSSPDPDKVALQKALSQGDQGLIAAALYTAGLGGQPCAIVSYDQDIPNHIALAQDALPELRDELRTTPVRVYWNRFAGTRFYLVHDGSTGLNYKSAQEQWQPSSSKVA